MFQIILLVALVALLAVLELKNGWISMLYKTLPRDLKAVVRFIKLNITLYQWTSKDMTVPRVFAKIVKKYPNKIAFHFENEAWTFQQVEDYSNKVANYFKNEGFKQGDILALLLENRAEYVCFWLGLSKIGCLTALINTNLTNDPLKHTITVAHSKAVIFGANYASAISEIRAGLGSVKYYQFEETPTTPKPLMDDAIDLLSGLENTNVRKLEPIGTTKDKILYIYTSGTTGLPKAAVITHLRFFFMSLGLRFMAAITPEDIIYDPLPLYHSAGLMVGVGQTIFGGTTIVIRKKFSASNFWKDCQKYQCTVAQYIGEICRYLLAVPEDEVINHSVKKIVGNGLRPQIWKQFVRRFNIKEVFEFYGATEGNSNLVNIDSRVGAVGFVPRYAKFAYPVTLVRCDLNTGEPLRNQQGLCMSCSPGEPGVFLGKIDAKKAVNQFSGYADKKDTQKKIFENVFRRGDMYFNSGDILVQDELGYFYFRDRTGDTFRWKGENVATSEVEAVISNLVNLTDAVVYGVEIPHTDGRAGMAAVVDTQHQLNLEDLAKGLKASLPAYAIPIFVRVLKSVQLTGTFKLKKVDLQEEGFNVNKIKDDIYIYDPKNVKYVKLVKESFDKICSGQMRL